MRILAIDTSCDETACAVTENTTVLSNIVWSQASLHAKFGGIMPSLAQRMHEERIDWVINRSMQKAKSSMQNIDAIAVTVGPGLAIALGVGIDRAKKLARLYKKPLIPINHVESHLLSPLARPNSIKYQVSPPAGRAGSIRYPAFGLVLSGGTTLFTLINKIGNYQILAETQDDALGEALDKAARLLGLGYPGGPILEKIARSASSGQAQFNLPVPLAKEKVKNRFSYSGLKTAFVRLLGSIKDPTKEQICNLAASFQETAFEHIIQVLKYPRLPDGQEVSPPAGRAGNIRYHDLLLGGGVANNILLRRKLRKLCRKKNLTLHLPYSRKLMTDNAAMVGVAAYLKIKSQNLKLEDFMDYSRIDRKPKMNI